MPHAVSLPNKTEKSKNEMESLDVGLQQLEISIFQFEMKEAFIAKKIRPPQNATLGFVGLFRSSENFEKSPKARNLTRFENLYIFFTTPK